MRSPRFDEEGTFPNLYAGDHKVNGWERTTGRTPASEDLTQLELKPEDVMIDIGCGPGYHALHAATICQCVHCIDISQDMLKIALARVREAGMNNIRTHLGGFLAVDFNALHANKAFSWGVLHQIPDAWKAEALLRVADALPVGGMFLLMDLAFSFHPRDREESQNAFISEAVQKHGEETGRDILYIFEEKFVTYQWVLERFLVEAGFVVRQTNSLPTKCWSNFLCVKR